jgi:hypothetical protein
LIALKIVVDNISNHTTLTTLPANITPKKTSNKITASDGNLGTVLEGGTKVFKFT